MYKEGGQNNIPKSKDQKTESGVLKYEKPEIISEERADEKSMEKIQDTSLLRDIILKTLKWKKESPTPETVGQEEVKEEVVEYTEIEDQIEKLKLMSPKSIPEQGAVSYSEISKQKPIIYIGKKFAGMQVWSQDGGQTYFIGQDGNPEYYFIKPTEEEIEKYSSKAYLNIKELIKPISEFQNINEEKYQEKYSSEEMEEQLKKLKEEKEIKEHEAFLKERGVLQEVNGLKIWDLEKLLEFRFSNNNLQENKLRDRLHFIKILAKEEGISKEEFETTKDKSKLKPKKLFYIPDSYEQAFDPVYVKNIESLLEIGQIGGNINDFSKEIELKSGEKITEGDLALTRGLFKELDLERNEEDGKLYFTDKKGEKRRFSPRYFQTEEKYIFPGSFLNSPIDFVKRNAINILRTGIFRENDFQLQEQKSGTIFRKGYSTHKRTGQVYIGGAAYILGKENAGKKLVRLDKDNIGVLEEKTSGKEELVRILKLKSEEEKTERAEAIRSKLRQENKKVEKESSYLKANTVYKKEECDITEYDPTASNNRLENESEKDYLKRMMQLADFDFINEITGEISRETGIGVHNELSWKEQQWLATAANESEEQKNKIVVEAKKYGSNFLRAFLSCEQGLKDGQKIIFMAEKLKPEVAQKVFDKYSEIVLKVEEITKSIPQVENAEKTDKTRYLIEENLLKRARELLLKYAKEATKKEINEDRLMFELENCEADTMLLAAIYKKSGVELEDIKDVTLKSTEQKDVKDEEKAQMLTLAMKNSKNREFDDKVVLHSLQEALKNNKNKFYLLKNKDKIVSFLRLEETEDGSLYFGSFNTDINAQSSGLGNAFMERTIDEVAREHSIKANVEVDNPVAQNYVNQRNFVITNILRDVAGTKVDGFDIVRNEKQNKETLDTEGYSSKEEFFTEAEDRLKSGEVIVGYVLPTKENAVFKVTYGRLKIKS